MEWICCLVVIDTCICSCTTREVDHAVGIGRIVPVSTIPIVGDGDNRSLGYGTIVANTLCVGVGERKEELVSLS
jgi:hypothetical protein